MITLKNIHYGGGRQKIPRQDIDDVQLGFKVRWGTNEPENRPGRLLVNQSAAVAGVSVHRIGVLTGWMSVPDK